jgi:signal transduction histidine kinase
VGEPVELGELLRDVARRYASARVPVTVSGSGTQWTAGDERALRRVLTNLVDNAVRHGEGQVTLTAVRTTLEPECEGVLLHVDDEGEGISPDIRSRVFTKFWKHGTRGGSGLGMYIVHGLVTAHGGSVEISDSPAGGARVTLVWPCEDGRPD